MSPEEFANEFGPEFTPAQPENVPAAGPYGQPVQPAKPGLTKRGKVVLAVGVTVIAGGGMLAWQNHSEQVAANEVRAQELAIKQQQIELETMKELNKANAAQKKTEKTQDAEQQKQIDACVKTDKARVGRQLGVTYSSVLNDCQAKYGSQDGGDGSSMQEAASASSTNSGGGINPSTLLGVGVGGAVIVAVAARRGKKTNAA